MRSFEMGLYLLQPYLLFQYSSKCLEDLLFHPFLIKRVKTQLS